MSEGTTDALLSHAFLAVTEEPKRPRKPPHPHPRSYYKPKKQAPTPLHLSRLLFAGLLVRSPLCQGSFVFFSKEVWRALISSYPLTSLTGKLKPRVVRGRRGNLGGLLGGGGVYAEP